MVDILDKIIAHKRAELAISKRAIPQGAMLEAARWVRRPTISMRKSLDSSSHGIIAEFKRRSPSKGWINQEADVAEVVGGYRTAGAAAGSVLTDGEFFGGTLDDLAMSRIVASNGVQPWLPLLRKEFIIDPYQIHEARVTGADAVLLIASCLNPDQCYELAATAHSFSLEVLLEIHTEDELRYLNPNIDMLGVNNRNLGTFHTDIQNSFRLARLMNEQTAQMSDRPLLVSESGLSDAQTIMELRNAGFRGFLMGEVFMRSGNPALAVSNLIDQLRCL